MRPGWQPSIKLATACVSPLTLVQVLSCGSGYRARTHAVLRDNRLASVSASGVADPLRVEPGDWPPTRR